MSIKTKIAVTLTVLLSACSTIFSGSSQTITFDSNVKENIEIYVNNKKIKFTREYNADENQYSINVKFEYVL